MNMDTVNLRSRTAETKLELDNNTYIQPVPPVPPGEIGEESFKRGVSFVRVDMMITGVPHIISATIKKPSGTRLEDYINSRGKDFITILDIISKSTSFMGVTFSMDTMIVQKDKIVFMHPIERRKS